MTTLKNYLKKDESPLQELLIKNLPRRIKAGADKSSSNINSFHSKIALAECKYINFNSLDRISMMIFDIDKVGEVTAKKYFKGIDGLFDFIAEKIGLEPTYILETDKGYHFGYALMNHVFTKDKKATTVLRKIKVALTQILGCDEAASHRLNGVWRNPLLHKHYFSWQFNYELKDFYQFLPKRKKSKNRVSSFIDINNINFEEGKRNRTMFYAGLIYANSKTSLTEDEIVIALTSLNNAKNVGLDETEIRSCAASAFKHWKNGTITLRKNKPDGAMRLPKINGLEIEEYKVEVKRRQRLAAAYANEKRDKSKLKESSQRANQVKTERLKNEGLKKINIAISELKNEGIKLSFASISRQSNLDKRTVSKYVNEYHLI